MPRYINADLAPIYLNDIACEQIKQMPTADVVEVVRCKDCKYSREMDKYEKSLYLESCVGCTHHSTSYNSLIMQGDDYCSYGDRKEDSK